MRKGSPPNVARIAIIDDDADNRRQLRELIQGRYPKVTVYDFEDIFSAYRGTCAIDWLIIDVSSVAPLMLSDVNRAWAPIGKYASEYPGTRFIIRSAMSRNAVEDVIDDCVEYGKIERSRLHYGGWLWESGQSGEALSDILSKLIPVSDTEWQPIKSKKR